MRSVRRLVAVAVALGCSTGCIIARPRNDTGPIRDRTSASQGMIVGHLRYPGHEIQGVLLYEEGTSYFGMEPRAPRAHVFPNGDFVFENLKPAAYRILCFYAINTYAVMTHETKDDPRHRFEVKPGKITYVGSYVASEGVYISRTDQPGLEAILGGLLPYAAGTYWERAIRERLAARR
jgi:hypothetical protein